MKKLLLGLSALSLLSACASFTPDYEVTDASPKSAPKWVEKASKAAEDSAERKEFRFYNADAENVNKRLCQKAAEARATQKIASEIAQEIIGKFNEDNTSADDTATAKLKDSLEQKIKTSLHGVQLAGQYWEYRHYKPELGAPADLKKYKCDAVVKIKIKALEDALEAYKKKTLKTLSADQKEDMAEAIDAYKKDLREDSEEQD